MKMALGIHFGGLDVDVAEADVKDPRSARLLPSDTTVPPAAILSFGAPLGVHRKGPLPLDGAGLPWPDVAKPTEISDRPETGRIPVPKLWSRFLGPDSNISGRVPPDRAEDALALLAEDAVVRSGADEAQLALVIPNELDEGRQQRLLDACRLRGLEVSLLWRPVAAALAWLELHGRELHRTVERDTQVGSLLCVHVGLDGVEAAWLDLIQQKADEDWIRPARTRPQSQEFAHEIDLGRSFVEAGVYSCLSQSSSEADRWRALWASPLLMRALGRGQANIGIESFGFGDLLSLELKRCLESSLGRVPKPPGTSGRASTPFQGQVSSAAITRGQSSNPMLAWADRVRLPTSELSTPVGAIVTGSLASLKVGDGSLGELLVQGVARGRLPRVECEGLGSIERGALARQASIYLARRNARMATYLDTLPQMEVLTEKRAEPVWRPLITSKEKYVPGGEVWKAEEDFGGLSVKPNEPRFKLDVWVEGEEQTREALFELPEPPREPVAVALHAQVEPAGGRARVALEPRQKGSLGRRDIVLDWARAASSKKNRSEAIRDYPRRCPAPQPRGAWPGAWRELSDAIGSYRKHRNIRVLRSALSKPQPGGVGAARAAQGILMRRPLDSNGKLFESDRRFQPEIDSFIEELLVSVEMDLDRGRNLEGGLLATLGYACARGPIVNRLCTQVIRNAEGELGRDEAYFLAGCARQPVHIAGFAKLLAGVMERKWTGFQEVMKSFGFLISWEDQAADALPTDVAERLMFQSRQLLAGLVAPDQVVGDGPGYVGNQFTQFYKYTLVLIAFLLRKRISSTAFFPPDSNGAAKLKGVLEIAQVRTDRELARPGQYLDPGGGMVNVPQLVMKVIEYVDEQGTGTIETEF